MPLLNETRHVDRSLWNLLECIIYNTVSWRVERINCLYNFHLTFICGIWETFELLVEIQPFRDFGVRVVKTCELVYVMLILHNSFRLCHIQVPKLRCFTWYVLFAFFRVEHLKPSYRSILHETGCLHWSQTCLDLSMTSGKSRLVKF